jgi:hypothetical protein
MTDCEPVAILLELLSRKLLVVPDGKSVEA